MPIFEYDGKKYNVREEHIDSFMKQYPDATSVMERDGKKYRVKSVDYKAFMSEQAGDDGERPTATTQGSDNPVQQEEAHQPTPQEMQQFSAQLKRTTDSLKQTTDSLNERMDNIREYSSHFGNGNTVEGQMRFNAETGKIEHDYITPLGNRYTDKTVADAESFRFRQTADMSISGQLRRANLKLAELKAKRQHSAQRVHDAAVADYKENTAPLAAVLFADTYSARQMSDKENSALDVAIRQTEELIKDLEEQRDREQGKDVGFWRGFGRTAGDYRTWDFGMSNLRDAMTMMHADSYTDENATENEREAYNEMMGALHNKEQAEQAYGGNADFWNRAGVMTGYMPSFMLDFAFTGGGFDGISAVTKGSGRLATKVLGRKAAREMAEQGFKSYVKKNGLKGLGTYATDWTIKALGTTADDLLIRAPLMTNTVQVGNTVADIIDRKLGDVVVNEDGSYDFSNDATWGDAIWQGEANAIIENYSEMFGAHLDPVITLGNMSKLANVVGAKRLGNVLAKADAGALNGIMGQTQALFNKMGVNDYFGEVTEEYYGQLWRTMLNLDDAYQTNPDGSRTNLLATGQFHGDIWGGMALSMGMMGAGKHAINAASYTSMKHGVNKADVKVNEMLGSEIWEPLKATLDLTTNDNIGEIAELIVNDADFTNDEKAAVLDYMERSMYMRGLNLASVAQGRNAEQNPDVQQANESYLDGYNIERPQEMNDAKNLYEYHRQRVSDLVDDDMMLRIDNDPISAIEFANSNEEWNEDERTSVIDYINAKQVYDGMIHRVRDDIDGRIEQSSAMVDARTNRTTGMIQPATMKADDRRVYVINGNLVPYVDGSGIDNAASDNSIIIRDAETGALEQVSPDAILNIDEALNPFDEKQTSANAIRQQFAREAADKIDGVASFNPGDTYTVTGEQGEMNVQIVANEAGIVDNGDGTVNATTDGTEIITIPKEVIQQQVDAANIARVAEFEQARTEENLAAKAAEQEAQRPTYTLNDTITLRDENGNSVRGSITADSDADGRYEVYTENPINGQRVNLFTREDIDVRLMEHNGTLYEQPTAVEEAPAATQTQVVEASQQSAFERVPKDEQGNPLYEQADSDTAWDAIVEQTEGDENMAQTVANGMVADKEAALKKAEKTKSKGGATIAEKIAAEKERTANIVAAKQELDIWKQIANVSARRKADIESERRRQAEEAAAARRTEEEKLRAEREEAERIEREALNGVPDIVNDTPKDARSRGYRRVSGHKVDRQEPLQPVQGKPVAIKFSNDAISNGRIAIIDASQLQPSHIQGQRNPLHFIDEAQPKERNDQASVVSATKIASHIRPEEITSSVTAYTGAPTINARGEVIQGNNRGFSLRLMWKDFGEQAEQYRQYLKDNAVDFGLTAEDIDSVQNPVLVNMLDVDDDTAITLGQYVAQDTESGGVERIKPKNTLQKMGANMRTFANMLLKSTDDETSFAGLVDRNGTEVLKWMNTQGFITATQFKSAFDSKGNLTPEAKNDLRGIMYNSIFQGGSTLLEEMFNAMPAKAQKAILSTAYRDYDSPSAERMVEEIQNSIRAYYALSQDKLFVEATNFKDARMAVESWKRQYQIDDATGESYLPAENFSNFALHLATMYKGGTQSLIQGTFNKLYDLIQGAQEGNLFEQPDNTPRSLAQAINETLNFEYDGQQRSNVLAGNSAASQRGQRGSTGDAATGERVESGAEPADDTGSIERGSESGEVTPTLGAQIEAAEANTDTNPTDAQKAAGNYKKGHVQVGTFNVTVETPKGSVRSGVDASGKEWQTTMNNTYGYIRGTEGVDGDHIDVFLSDDIDGWNGRRVFVIDQYNTDGTFDEHKVMLGFNSEEDATAAYLSNYEKSWADDHKIVCSSVIIDEFEKWIDSSHRKTKPFTDYKTVKHESVSTQEASTDAEGSSQQTDGYTVEKRFHKKNNTDIYAVKFTEQMPREQFLELKKRVKDFGGYYSSFGKGGFIFDREADARRFAEAVLDPSGESLDDAAPLSLKDIVAEQEASATPTGASDDIQALETAYADAYRTFLADNMAQSRDEARRLALNLGSAIRKSLLAKKVKFSDADNAAIRRLKAIREDVKAEMSAQPSTEESAPATETKQGPAPKKNEGAFGLVSDERMEELKKLLRQKMGGQLNAGFGDLEILNIGLQLTAGYLDRGLRKFADYAKQMIDDFGDVIRPYLKAFYNGARDLPDVVSTGMSEEMDSYDEVSRFDIANFGKNSIDPFATAEMVVAEQDMQAQAADAKQQIVNQRNSKRRKENEQTTADTLALAEEAEVVASEAETLAETATDEREINRAVEQIDETLDRINDRLALLGYYEFDEDDSKFHESYGYMLTAEKKAVKDATNLAKHLVDDLGIKMDKVTGSTTPLGRKKIKKGTAVSANIAPAGGDITIRLPLNEGRELAIFISLDPVAERGSRMRGDNLAVESIMYRIEEPAATGLDKYGINRWVVRPQEATYDYLLQLLRGEARKYLPGYRQQSKEEQEWRDMVAMAERGGTPYTVTPEVEAELAKQRNDDDDTNSEAVNGYRRGDEVLYDRNGNGKWEKQRIVDFEDGRPVLDSFGASWITEIADWERIKPVDGVFGEAEIITRQMSEKKGEKKTSKKKVAADATIGNLFNFESESNIENNDGNDIRRNDAVRTERLSADSRGHEKRLSERTESGSESQPQDSGRTDERGTTGSNEQHRAVRPRLSDAVADPKNTNNNHSERGADHAPTSVDARIDANIKAIELSRQLIENGDKATPEQMKVLRKFSGWGGLGKAFSDTAYSAKLQDLLGKEGYDAATMSANSSYYTPAYVVDSLWDIAQQLGFEGGRILEGSAGIGNILGQMPTSISERSDIHAVEIDPTSGGILSLLYPDAQVDIQGFEQTRIQNGSVDLAITNVPFVTGLRVNDTTSDKDLSRKFHNIHDFCIAKNVRKLRPGGIGIFITSNGTLDSSKKLRDWVVNEGGSDFVGAFRMNNKTFGGTAVTSDIIVIRKRVNGRRSVQAIDVNTVSGVRMAEFDTGETRKVKGIEAPVVKKLSMDYNKYFIDHPENMAGEMSFAFEHGDTFRPTSKGLYPTKDTDQKQMLSVFVQSFIEEQETAEETSTEDNSNYVADASADGHRLGELYEKDGQLVVAGFGGYYPLEVNANKVKGHTKVECFNAYAGIKKALADVMDYQTQNDSDTDLQPLLDRLNKAYDNFVDTYGHFNKNTAISFLRNDVDYPNVFSLERYEETGDKKGNRVQKFGKTDVFSRRVVEKEKEPTPTNVKDGIIASVYKFGHIDTAYIATQLGEDEEAIRRDILENGYGFEDPTTRQVEVSYQYLSGNVREKLRQAQENNQDGEYDKNIKALQEILPMDIPAHLIDFTLGSSWIDPKLYDEYVKDRTDVDVKFTAVGGTWFMDAPADWQCNNEKNRSTGVYSTMFNRNIFGHTLIEAAMQNRSITVSQTRRRYDNSTETITDKEATQACSVKIDEIRSDFKDWARQKMQSDSEMSAVIEREYNDMFNNYVPMSIPDEFVPEYFGGASHKFKMRPHQGRAIVRGTMQPLLLAHEVGTGKTFTLISTAMEMRRLGTARKPMIVVQNATVGQFVASAKDLYPNAKILTLEEADRSAEGRKNFYAKIRYNDWDMIVVPQSTFEFIPDSEERQMAYIQSRIEEKMLVLDQMKDADPKNNSAIARQAKQEVEKLRDKLAELTKQISTKRSAAAEKKRAVSLQNAEVQARELLDRRTDDIENFDDMGIDALLVDEAHEYKHLGFATAMQRGVKGVDPSPSKKSQGVYLKAQAVLEKNNGRNVVFATGTPISNTAAEIWTFMRYLMPEDTMKEYGIYYFDDFVRNFGNIQQMLEFTTSGKFKENNRFAGYINLPELVRIWSGVSDTVLTKDAGDVNDKIPDIEGGKAQDIYLPQTRALRGIMKFVKAELDAYDKMSGKEKKENSHIPLTMYGIAKAAAVDARLVVDDAEDDPNSKTNEAVRQTLRSLKETAKYKGTVAIFADNYQNKESGFNLYDDIREKLIAQGVPAAEVVVIRSGMTVKKKLEIFDKVNRGEIRVILGSTFTLGTGVNIQERLHTLIHLDAPNRPMDYTQRNGRILRQGNLHKAMDKPVRVLRFGVEDSLDVTAYQRLKTKGAIADSIMNGKQMMMNSMTNRVLEEEEDVFGDTVAQLSGSEYAMLKNNAEKNVRKFESRKKQWEAHQTYIHNAKPRLKGQIAEAEKQAGRNREFLRAVQSAFPNGKFDKITIGKKTFITVDEAADFIKEHNKSVLDATKKMKETAATDTQTRELTISVGGFTFKVRTELSKQIFRSGRGLFSEVHRKMTYSCPELGLEDVPVHQSLLRNAVDGIVQNVITGKDFSERIEAAENKAAHDRSELKQLLSSEGVPFEYDNELKQAREQLREYSELMKKEMAEKEAKYAEIDSSVEIADVISDLDDDDVLMRDSDTMYRIREDAAPTKTGIGYKVFVLKNGKLYPPMVANPNGDATPFGVWLDADVAPITGQSKTGRNQVKAGGKGTQGGSGKLAYRPGWHLGEIPYALQFNRNDENGERNLFPANFVWAEVEYADDVDYQDEAMSYGINPSGKFQHSLAGLPRVPENGAYRYRTNPNPETDPWIITGAMRVNRLLTPSEVDAMVEAAGREPQRRQDGAITDEQITELNAELQQQAVEDSVHPKAVRREMAEQVYTLAKKLNLGNVEVVTRVSGLQGKKATAKGFYTKSTGKITVVIPNNTSLADAQRTLLHEAVAHYGLRQMFGAQFDTFLDNVFDNADKDVRERIVALAAKNGWDFRKATEEYLAQLAENTEFERARQSSWWQKIKDFFVDMLNKIGFADFDGASLTDNELRYILWRSYENLKEGAYSSVFSEAADTAKQYELNVGEFDPENDILRRDGDPEMHERALARERYEQRVRSGMFQSREAIQDSMLGLKEAMLAILGEKTDIENVDGFENAYLGENRLSSVNKAEADAFAHTLFKPMLDEVARLAPTKREREELTDYMMAKHGLERNRVMAERDARKAVDAGSKKPYDELLDKFRENDYAGLTALTGLDKVDDAEAEAERMVADYEKARETDDLWEKVNAVSKAILQKSYECGMMDKQTFKAVSDMYEFYIPLRGFDEKTSAEAYAYLSHRQSAFNAPIKRAQGRKSKADDPFANLQSMAESAIVQGNRNKLVKQKFLNFVLNHPSDLVSVNDLWLQYDNVTDEWRPVFPDNIGIDDTPDEVEQKMQNFEAKMSSLAEADPDTYKRGRDAVNIPYRVVESRDLRQHQVIVKRNGRDYLLTINGNPRAAQALNGQTNPDNDTSGAIGAILRAGEKINRQLSAFYTTRNPDFIVSNFVRDLLYSNAMTWVKESPNYALRYHRNYITKANPKKMKSLLSRYRKGTLNMDDATDAMFHQFMMNGGETGYANVRDIEQHKNDIRKELRKANGKLKIARAMELLGEQFDELNRAIENCARFAAYITSREMGRSLDRAIYDAKEISVNFNKKGSGAKFYDATGQTNSGNVSALVSGLGRSGFVFWNAAIQGTTNFGKQLKRHPAKAYTGAAALFLLGVLIAYLGGDDDDDDKNAYYNLPEYVRRSNILFSIGNHWVSIPLPIEFRAFYGMGELMTSLFSGKEHLTDLELASAIAGQATQILPIDFLEGGGGLNAFIPSSVKPLWEAYVVEKGWTGMPLYKNTPYNKDMPEWTKAYGNANRYIVGLANALNESTGGDAYTKGAIDLNPAKIEYMLNGYFGGVFGTIDKLTKTAETIVGAREYDPRSILLMNRLVKAGDERTEFRAVNKEYFRLKEEHDRLKARLKHYEDDTDNGVFDYAEKIDFLYNSPEYERYEIFEDYRQEIDDLYGELKETVDDEERKEIEAELNEVKKEMISEINLTRNRK